MSGLSPQQRKLVELTALGLSNKEIASKMSIETNTVSKYRDILGEKIGVKGVANLTRYAIREGIVSA